MEYTTVLSISVLVIVWFEHGWSLYLTIRQKRVAANTKNIPSELKGILVEEKFTKARSYSLDKINYSIVHASFSTIVETLTIVLFILPKVWGISIKAVETIGLSSNNEYIVSIVFMLIFNTIQAIISLPFQVYSTFWLEEKHGFNNQTVPFFIKDSIKAYILGQFLITLITSPLICIIKTGGEYFTLYLWIFSTVFVLLLMTIYPVFIAPLFDKYTPLADGSLKVKIEQLAASVGFPLTKIYVVEGSKRSDHSNAYLYGFFNNKRIVLFDTLLKEKPGGENNDVQKDKGCTEEEVVAILAHELGHWKYSHVLKNMAITQFNLLLYFVAFGAIFKYSVIYESFGFYESQPVLIGLVVIFQFLLAPFNFSVSLLGNVLSRKFEFEADQYAKVLGKTADLKKALIKLNLDNLSFPVYDWLFSTFNHSHPPLMQRLQAMGKDD